MSHLVQAARQVIDEVGRVVSGKDECVEKVMAAIIAKGHILIEDIPGVGKTTMAVAFSKAMELTHSRVQFTPDVLPSDVTGFSMYEKDKGTFQYMEGPVMSNIFLADEINRTSPKTQSALLEVMEEGAVTIDGKTFAVPTPFIVIATQNPVGSAGTQMLPESQLDRFMISLQMGYPELKDEMNMLKQRERINPLEEVRPILTAEGLREIQNGVDEVYIHDVIYEYITRLARKTREHEELKLGVSPRGALALSKMTKAVAFLRGRDYVQPDDVLDIFPAVTAHRILLKSGVNTQQKKQQILEEVVRTVKKPVPKA